MIVKLLTEHQLKRRLQRLVIVYTYQNAILLEVSWTGSIIVFLVLVYIAHNLYTIEYRLTETGNVYA